MACCDNLTLGDQQLSFQQTQTKQASLLCDSSDSSYLIQFWHLIITQHWQVPLSKRFRALKLWFVLRNYGISGLQSMIRENVRLAGKFEALVRSDTRFEIPASRHLGMVVFRLKGDCAMTEKLLKKLNSRLDCSQ